MWDDYHRQQLEEIAEEDMKTGMTTGTKTTKKALSSFTALITDDKRQISLMRYAYQASRELQNVEFARLCRPDKAFTRIRHKQSALCQ